MKIVANEKLFHTIRNVFEAAHKFLTRMKTNDVEMLITLELPSAFSRLLCLLFNMLITSHSLSLSAVTCVYPLSF